MGVNRAGSIYLWENDTWTKQPGAATWAAIGDGDERWVINSQQQIFRWNHSKKSWDRMPGAAVNIDVQNSRRVIVTNAVNQIYIWKNNNWQLIKGSGTRSTINKNKYFTVNSNHEVFSGQ